MGTHRASAERVGGDGEACRRTVRSGSRTAAVLPTAPVLVIAATPPREVGAALVLAALPLAAVSRGVGCVAQLRRLADGGAVVEWEWA